MTYTHALITVPKEVHDLIRDKLEQAEYDHAIDEDEETLDMNGLALIVDEDEVTKTQLLAANLIDVLCASEQTAGLKPDQLEALERLREHVFDVAPDAD